MLQMNIISKVEIETLTEEYIKSLIIADITRQNPDVQVDDIEFTQRKDPKRVEAEVSARLGTGGTLAQPVVETASEGDSDKQEEIPLDEAVQEEVATTTVADIFGA